MIKKFKKILHTALTTTLRAASPAPLTISVVPEPYNYEAVKAELLQDELYCKDGTNSNKKNKHLETLLDNTYNDTVRSNGLSLDPTVPSTIESLKTPNLSVEKVNALNVILPIVKKIVSDSIAWDIVGVQPMTGPVGQIHTLRVRCAEDQRLNIQILKEIVEARTRSFSTRLDETLPKDIDKISKEIVREIDGELINHLIKIAETSCVEFNTSQLIYLNEDQYNNQCGVLTVLINRISNLIAMKNRRGYGNFCIVSPYALKLLENASNSNYISGVVKVTPSPINSGVQYVGTVNSSLKVYCNTDAADNTPVLVGYNGQGNIDSGLYYCPYLPLVSSGVIIDPNTLNPVYTFMTRYGTHELESSSSSVGNSSDYYGIVKFVTNDTQSKPSTQSLFDNKDVISKDALTIADKKEFNKVYSELKSIIKDLNVQLINTSDDVVEVQMEDDFKYFDEKISTGLKNGLSNENFNKINKQLLLLKDLAKNPKKQSSTKKSVKKAVNDDISHFENKLNSVKDRVEKTEKQLDILKEAEADVDDISYFENKLNSAKDCVEKTEKKLSVLKEANVAVEKPKRKKRI